MFRTCVSTVRSEMGSYLTYAFANLVVAATAASLVPWIQLPSLVGELALCLSLRRAARHPHRHRGAAGARVHGRAPGRIASTRQRPRWSFVGRWLPAGMVERRPGFVPAVPWRVLAVVAMLLAALALAAVYVGSQRRLPPPFGLARPGAIAYVADGDIWRANADGTSAVQLTRDPRLDTRPVFSRDGTRLAITRLSQPGSHPNWEEWSSILISDVDGGHPVLIDDDQEGVSPIAWSSDGRFIVYSKLVDAGDHDRDRSGRARRERSVANWRRINWDATLR